MKRMELRITLTFVIMFVVWVIISGINSVTSMESSFFTFEVMANAMFAALVYLFCIWMNTRRHQLLTILGVLCIAIMFFCILFSYADDVSTDGVSSTFSYWTWKDTVMCIYCIIVIPIAELQGKKLLEEDKQTVKINVYLQEGISPEDVKVTSE